MNGQRRCSVERQLAARPLLFIHESSIRSKHHDQLGAFRVSMVPPYGTRLHSSHVEVRPPTCAGHPVRERFKDLPAGVRLYVYALNGYPIAHVLLR
jgi:hypothetical protein